MPQRESRARQLRRLRREGAGAGRPGQQRYALLPSRQLELVLQAVRSRKQGVRLGELAKALGVDMLYAYKKLRTLRRKGLVERVGVGVYSAVRP